MRPPAPRRTAAPRANTSKRTDICEPPAREVDRLSVMTTNPAIVERGAVAPSQ